MDKSPLDLSDIELDMALTEIDRELRQESDLIRGRELRGWMKFCQQFRLSISMTDPLSQRVFDWFNRIYGDRLKIDFDLGASVVPMQGDLYRIRCIRFYGVMYAIASSDLIGKQMRHRTPQGVERPIINLIDDKLIEGLTPELASRLSKAECDKVLEVYSVLYMALSNMESAVGAPHIKEALDDLRTSGDSLVARNPNYGQSNWASLQATEKVLKSYILKKGGRPKKIHDLTELCQRAHTHGLTSFAVPLVQAVQCSADVRYDSKLVSKEKALEAHYAALSICRDTARLIKRTKARSGVEVTTIRIGGLMIGGLALGYNPPTPLRV